MSTDSKLLAVVEHWLPRMEVGGVPGPMARTIIERAGDWSGWLDAWCDAAAEQEQLAETALARGWLLTAGEGFARAALLCHFGQFMAFEDLARKERVAAQKCALYRRAAPLLSPPAEYRSFQTGSGVVNGYLRLPRQSDPVPLVLIVPGSDSTKEEFPLLEQVFLSRGMATLSLDGPGQGEGRSLGPLRPDISAELAAVLAQLDGDARLSGQKALVGMAFGGFLALRAACRLDDLAAVVSINGFADLGSFAADMPQVYRDNMTYALGTSDVIGRARDFTLAGAGRVRAPALILHGALDRIFPPDQAHVAADYCDETPDVRILQVGNHVCNNIAWYYRPLVADWVGEKLRNARQFR